MVYREKEHLGYKGEVSNHIEHAGVFHLVHGWVQQNQNEKVSFLYTIYAPLKLNIYRVFTYPRA
jgi:hypothetical protein